MVMRPEIKSEWCRRLNEEGRTQTSGVLRNQYGAQCCLDVLMEMGVEAGVQEPPLLNEAEGHWEYDSGPCLSDAAFPRAVTFGTLTSQVIAWAGVSDYDPSVEYDGDSVRLSELNDDRQLGFKYISSLIEADQNI